MTTKPILIITGTHRFTGKTGTFECKSIEQAKFLNPYFENFRIVKYKENTGSENMTTEKLGISKNKLIMLSSLLKKKKQYLLSKNKQDVAKKYNIQRGIIETILTENAVDNYIDKLKKYLENKQVE